MNPPNGQFVVTTDSGGKAVKLTESHGFAEDEDVTIARTAGHRLFCVGDSVTYGLLPNSQSFPHILEAMLDPTRKAWQVVNAGKAAESTYTALLRDSPAQTSGLSRRRARAHQRAGQPARRSATRTCSKLLDAGIHVMTAVNIQHLETLNDAIARATGVRVRETVPDTFLDRADEVINVDVTVEELRNRPASRARSTGPRRSSRRSRTSSARATCRRCVSWRCARWPTRSGEKAASYRAREGLEPALIPERVMVCMSSNALAPRVIRTGARIAGRLGSKWYAVYVETPREKPDRIKSQDRDALQQNIRLAESLGATVVRVRAERPSEGLVAFAQREGITHVIFGQSARSRWELALARVDAQHVPERGAGRGRAGRSAERLPRRVRGRRRTGRADAALRYDASHRLHVAVTLRTRLLLGLSAFVGALIVSGGWSAWHLWRMSALSERIIAENYNSVVAAQDMKESLERQDSAGLFVLLRRWDRALVQIREHRARFDAAYQRAAANVTEPGEADIVRAIGRTRDDYYRRFDRFVLDAPDDGSTGDAPPRLRSTSTFASSSRASPSCAGECDRLLTVNQDAMRRKAAEAATLARRWFVTTLWTALTLVIGGIGFAILLSNSIIRPVRQLTDATSRMAAGHLDTVVDVRSGDELGVLAARFNDMADHIRQLRQSDLGQIRLAQQTAEAAVDSLYDPVIVTDGEGRVQRINRAAQPLFGPEAAVLGRRVQDVTNDPRLSMAVLDVLESQRTVASEESAAVVPLIVDGAERSFRQRTTPMRDDEGRLVGAVMLLEDITHLREIDRLKSEFVAGASHELRTPLTSLEMGVHLLLEATTGELSPKQRELLVMCRDDTLRLDRLVKDLLDLSRIESGEAAPQLAAVHVADLVAAALEPLRRQVDATRPDAADRRALGPAAGVGRPRAGGARARQPRHQRDPRHRARGRDPRRRRAPRTDTSRYPCGTPVVGSRATTSHACSSHSCRSPTRPPAARASASRSRDGSCRHTADRSRCDPSPGRAPRSHSRCRWCRPASA